MCSRKTKIPARSPHAIQVPAHRFELGTTSVVVSAPVFHLLTISAPVFHLFTIRSIPLSHISSSGPMHRSSRSMRCCAQANFLHRKCATCWLSWRRSLDLQITTRCVRAYHETAKTIAAQLLGAAWIQVSMMDATTRRHHGAITYTYGRLY